MLETKQKLIGSDTYYVSELPASAARKLLVRIVKALGPILGNLLEDGSLTQPGAIVEKVSTVDSKTLAKMLATFSDRIKEDDLEHICRVLGEVTMVETSNGGRVPLDMEMQELHFRGGRLSHLFRWLGFALEVQYADFFPSASPGKQEPPAGKDS